MPEQPQYYLVIDIGGTFIKYAIMSEKGEFLQEGKVPTDTSGPEALLASMKSVREAAGGGYVGVAVSMPGRIDTAAGVAHTGGALMWVRDWPAASEFEAVFGTPVTIANDGKCAALAESWRGALADEDSGCVIVLGTGIGGGIVVNNRVLMGSSGAAGELSFLPVDYTAIHNPGHTTTTMARAMWCSRVAASAISARYARAKGLEHADGVMLLDAYEAGEPEAVQVMEQFGRDMAAGIFAIQGIVDVPRYAIGGGISARPEVTSLVRDAVDELWSLYTWTPFARPEVVACRFGNEANLIGALAFHLQQ